LFRNFPPLPHGYLLTRKKRAKEIATSRDDYLVRQAIVIPQDAW
jgi:hypothetical protein